MLSVKRFNRHIPFFTELLYHFDLFLHPVQKYLHDFKIISTGYRFGVGVVAKEVHRPVAGHIGRTAVFGIVAKQYLFASKPDSLQNFIVTGHFAFFHGSPFLSGFMFVDRVLEPVFTAGPFAEVLDDGGAV